MSHTEALEDLIDEHLASPDCPSESSLFQQIQENSNQAFAEVLPHTSVMIPIAAAQESPDYTQHTLSELAGQMRDPHTRPFSVLLSANYPSVDNLEYEENRKRNIAAIRDFQQSTEGQHLPLSYFEQKYDPKTTIGKIRKDLADVTLRDLRARYARARMPENAALFISEIDTLKFSPSCFSRLQGTLEKGFSWAAAHLRYPTSKGKYPQLDRAISAINLETSLDPRFLFECHSMYSINMFLHGRGFMAKDAGAETLRMQSRAKYSMGSALSSPSPQQIPGAIAVSHPRRPFEKLRQGRLLHEFWLPGEFTMQDAYREGKFDAAEEDISPEFADFVVADEISRIVCTVRDRIMRNVLSERGNIGRPRARNFADQYIARVLGKANVLLGLELERIDFLTSVMRPS